MTIYYDPDKHLWVDAAGNEHDAPPAPPPPPQAPSYMGMYGDSSRLRAILSLQKPKPSYDTSLPEPLHLGWLKYMLGGWLLSAVGIALCILLRSL